MELTSRHWGILLVLLALLCGSAWYAAHQRGSHVITLTTTRAARGAVATSVSGTGTLQPVTTVEVKSNVGGTLVALYVDEGDSVKTGQIIAKIDPTDAKSTLEQTQADLEGARSKVTQAQQTLGMQHGLQDAQLKAAQLGVEAAKIKLTQAEKEATLQVSVTSTTVEQAQQNLASAQARLKQAEQQSALQPQLTDTSIAESKSNYDAAKTAYEQTKSSLSPQKIAGAQSALDQAKANYVYAQKDLERQKQLQLKGYVPRSDVEAAEQRFVVAQAQQTSAQQKMDTVQEEARDDLDAAEARMKQAASTLKTAEANRAQDAMKEQDVTAARATVKQAEAALQAAKANGAQDSLKQDDVAGARAALATAEANLAQTQANAIQTQVKAGDIVQASATVKRSVAAVTDANTNLNYTSITAPRAGVVIKKYVDVGTVVAGARNAMGGSGTGVNLVDIADISRMQVVVDVDETDIAQIFRGQNVEVTVDAYAQELFVGKVTKIAPEATTTQNVTTVAVTVDVDSPDLRLKPGMNATCNFITGRHDNVLTVPTSAVKRSTSGSTVQVIGPGGAPIPRTVHLGLGDSHNTEILSGVQEGEIVVSATRDSGKASAAKSSTGTRAGGGPPPMMMGGPR